MLTCCNGPSCSTFGSWIDCRSMIVYGTRTYILHRAVVKADEVRCGRSGGVVWKRVWYRIVPISHTKFFDLNFEREKQFVTEKC